MDTNFTSQLLLSILFFAPGLVVFAGLAFVGLLMLLEKTLANHEPALVLLPAQAAADFALSGNPAPGRIVTALKQGMSASTANHQRKVNQ